MREVFIVFGKFNTFDIPMGLSNIEHDEYSSAMTEISNDTMGYLYYTIEKLFRKD